MGFFSEFAQGFSETATPLIAAKSKMQMEVDADRAKRIASIEPEMEVYKRKKDIEAAIDRSTKQQQMDDFARFMESSGSASPAAPAAPAVAAPQATISMTPTQAAPTTTDDPFAKMQKHTFMAGAAKAAGLDDLSAASTIAATMNKNDYEHGKDLINESNKPVASSEGINIVEQLGKDLETNIKAGGKSMYRTGSLEVNTITPSEAAKDQEIYQTIHAPLAQAFAQAQRQNGKTKIPYGSIKKQTIEATQNIVTLTSEGVAPEEKEKANKNLAKIFNKVYGSPENLEKAISSDENIATVVNYINDASVQQEAAAPAAATTEVKPADAMRIVTSDADYAAVPAGAQYKDPQGNIRTKKAQ